MEQKFITYHSRELRDNLINRVKAEQIALRNYLFELANGKVKEC